jgi:hypothetical protein
MIIRKKNELEPTKQNAPASLEIGTFVEAALPRSLLENKCNSRPSPSEWHFQAICKTMVTRRSNILRNPFKSFAFIGLATYR